MKLWPITEKKVRAALRDSGGKPYRVELGFLQEAWNPETVEKLGIGTTPFLGPGEVIYRQLDGGSIAATFSSNVGKA